MVKNVRLYKIVNILLVVLLVLAVGCGIAQTILVIVYDRKINCVGPLDKQSKVYSVIRPISAKSDSWETILPIPDVPEEKQTYIGVTCGIDVVNEQSYAVEDWTLRIDIMHDFYLNGFWCGQYEIHQFRDGEEIVEVVDAKEYDLDTMKLDHLKNTNGMFIHLVTGDYMIYHPSVTVNENRIEGNSYVGIGYIAYYQDFFALTNAEFLYRNDRSFTDGWLFVVFVCLCGVWSVLSILHAVSIVTYKNAIKRVESVTQSVVNGLSKEYKTLWLIHVEAKTIELIRNTKEAPIQNAVSIAQDFADYDTAIKYYVDYYIDEKDRARVWAEVAFEKLLSHLEEEDFYTVNYLHHPSDEECCYFQMAFTKANENGQEEKIILAYRDIDRMVKEEQQKQKQLEEALLEAEKANRSKTIFLANMSHEIRTPINAIMGMDTMILRESGEDNIREYAKEIKGASTTLLSIVNDILDFSKIESGKMEIIPAEYRLDCVVQDLLNMVKSRAEEKGLIFEYDMNPLMPVELIGDELRVKQIILNILNNAVKYTNQGSIHWSIDFEQDSEAVCMLFVKVSDTGIGIKPEDLTRICSPYSRLDETTNRSVEGTGLGLSITSNLLEKMGSRLEIESVYGEGSCFSFVLEQQVCGDRQMGTDFAHEDSREEEPERFHAPDAKILVVDDVDLNLIVIKNLLKRVRILPDECLSGSEAVKLANEKHYDLILMDAMMPQMSGEEALRLIRSESELNRETPIVVLTANAIVGAKEAYLEAGFFDYLSKPVDGIELENMIERILPKELVLAADTDCDVITAAQPMEDDQLKADNQDMAHLLDLVDQMREQVGLDTKSAIASVGDVETYWKVCENFVNTAPDRKAMISEYYQVLDLENYTIQVHALKSSARLIGALSLSEMALSMELAGRDQNRELISEKTDELLSQYDMIYTKLCFLVEKEMKETKKAVEKKDLTEKKLGRKLEDFLELIEAYDLTSARELFDSLSEYNLPVRFEELYPKIRSLIAEVNYDEIKKMILDYIATKEG